VQFEKALYSVPFRLLGQLLWLKAGSTTVWVFQDHQLVATHPRATASGQRSTVRDHLPPAALAWSMADPQYCLAAAERIGVHCRRVIEALFADRVLDNLRAAQGVIGLAKKHGNARVESRPSSPAASTSKRSRPRPTPRSICTVAAGASAAMSPNSSTDPKEPP
jgi:hypothetical protein